MKRTWKSSTWVLLALVATTFVGLTQAQGFKWRRSQRRSHSQESNGSGAKAPAANVEPMPAATPPATPVTAPVTAPDSANLKLEVSLGGVNVDSRKSLVHLGSLDSFDKTPGGVRAASTFLEGLTQGNAESIRAALRIYNQLVPIENFGGEYSSLAWFCECILASDEELEKRLQDPYVEAFYHMFADGDYAVLIEYLQSKYELGNTSPRARRGTDVRFRFLEDIMLFNNPTRETWEKSSKIIEAVGLKPGMKVVDLGSGPGFFTFKFSKLVGEDGKIYAIDINREHNEYVRSLAQSLGITNVVVAPTMENALQDETKADCIFSCSLYHVAYMTYMRDQFDDFIESIKQNLSPDGTFVVVDNGLVEDTKLPYHGPYISKDLLANQLVQYGFKLVGSAQYIPQRYILVFKLAEDEASETPPGTAAANTRPSDTWIPITTRQSLIHIPSDATLRVFSRDAERAATLVLDALETNNPESARAAMAIYGDIIPNERFGDEYTAFDWICEYILADDAKKKELLVDSVVTDYVRVLGENNWEKLKRYLKGRYNLKGTGDEEPFRQELGYWRDYILFNNPNRHLWEQTDKFMKLLDLKPGEAIADVGCGGGFFTFKFADMVGKDGRVYALDTNVEHLQYVEQFNERYGLTNVTVVNSAYNDVKLKSNSVDAIFLCSLYHIIYATSIEKVKDEFVESMKNALRKNGRLIIVDNAVVSEDELPYHAAYIAKELVIGQMTHYGFKLVKNENPIHQRFYLEFKLNDK